MSGGLPTCAPFLRRNSEVREHQLLVLRLPAECVRNVLPFQRRSHLLGRGPSRFPVREALLSHHEPAGISLGADMEFENPVASVEVFPVLDRSIRELALQDARIARTASGTRGRSDLSLPAIGNSPQLVSVMRQRSCSTLLAGPL